MEPRERLRETVRGIVTVFQGDLEDRTVRVQDLASGEGEAAITDVFDDREPAEHRESLLVIEGRDADVAGDVLHGQVLVQVFLDVLDRIPDQFHPLHVPNSFVVMPQL